MLANRNHPINRILFRICGFFFRTWVWLNLGNLGHVDFGFSMSGFFFEKLDLLVMWPFMDVCNVVFWS